MKKIKSVEPAGYNVLVDLLKVEEKTEGGIILTESLRNKEQMAMSIGKILKFGPLCFKNHDTGINTPQEWGVDVGDWIVFPSMDYKKVKHTEHENAVLILDHAIHCKIELDED